MEEKENLVEVDLERKEKFGIILPIVLISYFLILLNNSLIFTSTVKISEELQMNNLMVAWISNAYALTFGGFLAFSAKLGDIIGRKKSLLTGLVIFSLASLLVGMSQSATMIISMRALQGIGASLLAPATLALLMDNYQGEQLTRAIAYYGATAGIGSSLGMIIGGLIASYMSWRAGFYLGLIVGIILIVMSILGITNQKATHGAKIDWWGTITSVIGFSGLVYSLNGSSYRLVAFIVSIVTLIIFGYIESKVEHPLMPLVVFKDNQRISALILRFFMLGASMSYFFLMPQALQKVFGFSPLMASISFLPLTVIQFIVSLYIPRLTVRFSNTSVLISGVVVDTLGFVLGSVIGINSGYWWGVAFPMIFLGIGQGLIMGPATVAGVAGTSGEIAGAASGVVNTFHQIGGAVGLAFISTMINGLKGADVMIDQAQFWMVVLAIIMTVAAINILRGKHE
ncbi:MFS transporter [Ligilactobacillus salivarius]|uniref:MFS transporter n=1 Tax=Ligilactobacillus salivarius TaxID=1624 RepID=UPI0030F7869B